MPESARADARVRWTSSLIVVDARQTVGALRQRLDEDRARIVVVRRVRPGDPESPYFYAYLPSELGIIASATADTDLERALDLHEWRKTPAARTSREALATFAALPGWRAIVVSAGGDPLHVAMPGAAIGKSGAQIPFSDVPPRSPKTARRQPLRRKKNGGGGHARYAPKPMAADGGRGGNGSDPPRTAYSLIEAPNSVVVEAEFELKVGLSDRPVAGVGGGHIARPDWSHGSYKLDVQVSADGFSLRDGESWRRELDVTADLPYPTFLLHLRAAAQDAAVVSRLIQVKYATGGAVIGLGFRSIAVVRDASLSPGPIPPAPAGAGIRLPKGPPADLEVTIKVIEEASGRLEWTFDIRDGLTTRPPDAAAYRNIGRDPEGFARDLMNGMNVREGQPGIYDYLLGDGRVIAGKMPAEFWTVLRGVAAELDKRPPTVLFLTEDPHVPWELAAVEPTLDAKAPPFLAGQVVVGRWVFSQDSSPKGRPRQPPPTDPITVSSIAVVSGDYSKRPGWKPLEQAALEAAELHAEYAAQPIAAATIDVMNALRAVPGADVIHFACHGIFDPTSTDNGLVLTDGLSLAPSQVRALDFTQDPFIFLNACQVGQGSRSLGDYAGLAAAFLYAGAAGVIAPLWSVKDDVAREVAIRFYKAVFDGRAPADALREERRNFKRDVNAQSGTYLAYQFFGHPAIHMKRS